MNFWPFKPKPRKVEIHVVQRDRCKLTVEEWRTDTNLVSGARAMMGNSYMILAVDALRNSHPGFTVVDPRWNAEMRAALQSQAEGYTLCLRNLESLSQPIEVRQEVEATFEPDDTNPDKG